MEQVTTGGDGLEPTREQARSRVEQAEQVEQVEQVEQEQLSQRLLLVEEATNEFVCTRAEQRLHGTWTDLKMANHPLVTTTCSSSSPGFQVGLDGGAWRLDRPPQASESVLLVSICNVGRQRPRLFFYASSALPSSIHADKSPRQRVRQQSNTAKPRLRLSSA